MSGPFILVPTKITDAILTSSSIAEPDTAGGEVAWVTATAYVVGDERVDVTTHSIYSCVKDAPARTVVPSADPFYWLRKGPTNRWAPFDTTIATVSLGVSPYTIVLRPGFFNSVTMYALNGYDIVVSVKDSPGGTEFYRFPAPVGSSATYTLQEPPLDWYDWAFGQIYQMDKLVLEGITPYPDAELTITITASAGKVGVGMVNVGDLRDIISLDGDGGAEQGASAEPITYAVIETDRWGETVITDGPTATNLDVDVFMLREDADAALAVVQRVLGTPVSFITTTAPGHAGLNQFGLVSGKMNYNAGHAKFRFNVKGLI